MAANTEEMKNAISFMLDNMEMMLKQVELNAVLYRKSYETLIAAGFTEEQALEIVKARGNCIT